MAGRGRGVRASWPGAGSSSFLGLVDQFLVVARIVPEFKASGTKLRAPFGRYDFAGGEWPPVMCARSELMEEANSFDLTIWHLDISDDVYWPTVSWRRLGWRQPALDDRCLHGDPAFHLAITPTSTRRLLRTPRQADATRGGVQEGRTFQGDAQGAESHAPSSPPPHSLPLFSTATRA